MTPLFTNQQPFTVTDEVRKAFTRFGKRFNCKLCGKNFEANDTARWVYSNFKDPPVRSGNFFVCQACDTGNEDVLKRAGESYAQAVKLAKQWDIYGPEWQSDR